MKIVLILLLIHYVLFIIRKNKNRNSILACGLFAWVGKDVEDFSRDKFDKLGIYNDSRGKHSCGLMFDGKLHKGISTEALYKDFITKNVVAKPLDIPVAIGHTRFATSGAKTKINAHPFKFTYENEGYFVGAHNGSLINHKDLAKKYGVNEYNIDSQILLEIISKKDENIKVLEEYHGAAALLMYSSENKDTLYVFRGESKQNNSNVVTEERPLFYWQENENSMYLSSIKDSLVSIMNCEADKDNLYEIQPNNIYEIVGGKINRKLKIDRSKSQENYYANLTKVDKKQRIGYDKDKNNKSTTNSRVGNSSNSTTDHKINNFFYEKPLLLNCPDDVNFTKLRWQRNGHNVSGIYVFIDDVGYVKLCDSVEDVYDSLQEFSFEDKSFKPSEVINFGNIENVKLFYIHDGVMVETREDYLFCQNPQLANKTKPTFDDYSDMAVHPIIDLSRLETKNTRIDHKLQKITKAKKLFTGTIEVPGSATKYVISNGVLVSFTSNTKIKNHPVSINTLDAFESINSTSSTNEMEDEDDVDDISFEDNVNNLLNDNDNIDEIDTIIEICSNYKQAFELSKELEEKGPNSKLAKLVIDFASTLETSMIPISESLNKINSNH